jgi:sodium/hydrogen antiporter
VPASAPAVFAVAVVVFVSQSRRFERLSLSAPIFFTVVGVLLAKTLFSGQVHPELVRSLAELTLALVLFHDAAQVRPRQLRPDAGLCVRLLLVGLPLTMAAGYVSARLLFPGAGAALALLLCAALAPTDAGLGAATVLNPVVPARVRRVLNIESGLNDGLSTPVVLFAIASAATVSGPSGVGALRELALGLAVGVVLGSGCGLLLSSALQRGWLLDELLPVATLVVPVLTYYGAVWAHGNGFVSAFVSGTAFAAAADRASLPSQQRGESTQAFHLTDSVSLVLGYAVWTLFGLVAVAHLGVLLTWSGLAFGLLSLTVLRMVPVALVLLGSGLRAQTTLFIGWFGPRGLASVVFALLADEQLGEDRALQPILGAIAVTVLLSVVVHGLTAGPWAAKYGAWADRERPSRELGGSGEPTRSRLGRARAS